MARSLKGLDDFVDLDNWIDKAVTEIAQDMMIELATEATGKVPRATGYAQNYWTPGINKPGPTNASGKSSRTSGTRRKAVPGKPAFEVVYRATPPYPMLYLSSYVPYILKLEYGSSTQAPQGFARQAVLTVAKRNT